MDVQAHSLLSRWIFCFYHMSFVAQCSCGLYLLYLYIYIFFYLQAKIMKNFHSFGDIVTSSLKLFITYLSLFLKERLCQLYILWKIEWYFKILDLLPGINLFVIQVLQPLLKIVLCWMQFKAKAIKWPWDDYSLKTKWVVWEWMRGNLGLWFRLDSVRIHILLNVISFYLGTFLFRFSSFKMSMCLLSHSSVQ